MNGWGTVCKINAKTCVITDVIEGEEGEWKQFLINCPPEAFILNESMVNLFRKLVNKVFETGCIYFITLPISIEGKETIYKRVSIVKYFDGESILAKSEYDVLLN